MVCSLVTQTAVDVHGQILQPERTYVVSRYLVTEPGHGIHHRFHLRFDELTNVDLISDSFVDRVFSLRVPTEIPTCLSFVGSIYGIYKPSNLIHVF